MKWKYSKTGRNTNLKQQKHFKLQGMDFIWWPWMETRKKKVLQNTINKSINLKNFLTTNITIFKETQTF